MLEIKRNWNKTNSIQFNERLHRFNSKSYLLFKIAQRDKIQITCLRLSKLSNTLYLNPKRLPE